MRTATRDPHSAALGTPMLREHRLRRQIDFQRVREGGRSWAHPLVVLSALPNELDHTRVGLLVSGRLGNAVRRNRVRRVLREAVRHCLPGVRPGWDLVLIARPPLADAKLQPVEQALVQLLRRASLSGWGAENAGPARIVDGPPPTAGERR